MQLASCAHVRGGIVSNYCSSTRSTGELVTMPHALYLLADGMAAIPQQTLISDEQITIDLTTWSLYDLEASRSVGLVVGGEPGSDLLSRVATRYVREARHLPQHELAEWVQQVIEQMQEGGAA